MMKYFDEPLGGIDESALWAYEGIVIPGGQMVFGRWWSPHDGGLSSPSVSINQRDLSYTSRLSLLCHSADCGKIKLYCGPFIFWNVDRYEEDDEDAKAGCARHE